MGLPYVVSSDLVSAYPAKSLDIAQYVDGLIPLLAMTQNAQTGTTYTFLLTDFTKLVTLSNASAVAVTLPLESSVAWPAGTQLRLLNLGAGTVTVAGAVGVTISGTPLTLAQFKGANLIKTGTNTWVMLPFASGVGAAVFSDTPTGTYTGYAYKTFAASGTLTVTVAGFADIIVCGGGGSGGANSFNGGGAAGGVLSVSNAYLPVGTLTVTVGAGASGAGSTVGVNGSASRVESYYGIGGGGGGSDTGNGTGTVGGSGGGAAANATRNGATGTGGQGNAGGSATGSGPWAGGGGGGAAAVGANGSGSTGGAGGAGTTTSIAGTTPSGAYVAGSYALGGGGGASGSTTPGAGGSGGGGGGSSSGVGTNGTANTGGGGGAGFASNAGGNGGSGLVIVRVEV